MTNLLDPDASGKALSFDHAVIIVSDLEEAIANFNSLGFDVQRGGTTGPVHNALIYFRDGTYIELTTPVSRWFRALFRLLYSVGALGLAAKYRPTVMARFLLWFGGPSGLRDWCVRCVNMDKTIELLRAQGIETCDAEYFSRKRPDGEVAEWRLAGPTDRRLPFMIEDISPTEVRVPFQDASEHPNGVIGISAVVLQRDSGLKVLETLKRCVAVETTGNEACTLGSVTIRLADNQSAPRLALELRSSGEVKGPLPAGKTSGSLIVLV